MTVRSSAPLRPLSALSRTARSALILHPGRRGVPARVTVRASLLADLREELVATRQECREHAAEVHARARRIQLIAMAVGSPPAYQQGAALERLADRHARQRGPAA